MIYYKVFSEPEEDLITEWLTNLNFSKIIDTDSLYLRPRDIMCIEPHHRVFYMVHCYINYYPLRDFPTCDELITDLVTYKLSCWGNATKC